MFLFLPRCNYVPHKTQRLIVRTKIWNDDRRRGSKSAILPICQDTDNESKSAGERGRKRRMKRAVKRKKDALSGTSSSASAETFTETQLLDIAPVSLPHPAFPRDRALRRRMEAAKTVQPTP